MANTPEAEEWEEQLEEQQLEEEMEEELEEEIEVFVPLNMLRGFIMQNQNHLLKISGKIVIYLPLI